MKFCLDITPLVQPVSTGVQMVTRDITRQLLADYPEEFWTLFAVVPNGEYDRLHAEWNDIGPNVSKVFVKVPARLFHSLVPLWQRGTLFPVERFTGPVDHYHSFEWFHFPSRCKASATLHDWSPMKYPKWYSRENRNVFVQRWQAIKKHQATVVAISRFLANEVAQGTDSMRDLIVYIPNGIPIDCASPSIEEIQKTLETHSLESGFVLAVGTLAPRKNYETLFEAYAEYRKKAVRPRPLVVAANLNLSEGALRTRVPGLRVLTDLKRDELMGLYSSAAALFFPSWYEGFGLPVLEALQCRCPVVASDIPAVHEIGGDVIRYVEPGRVRAWTEEFRRLDTSPGINRDFLLKQAQKYSLSRVVSLYYEVMKSGGRK